MKNHEEETGQRDNDLYDAKNMKTEESDIHGAIIEEVDSNERMKESLENFIKRTRFLLKKEIFFFFLSSIYYNFCIFLKREYYRSCSWKILKKGGGWQY